MNKLEDKISIIIPCYNDYKYVEQAVNSALNQTYKNIEVILVDDGSNSETKNVLEKIKPKISILITQENKGQSTARNVGIKKAGGKYIVVLDSDDFFESTFCEKAINSIKLNDVKIVSCYANILHENMSSQVYKPSGGGLKKMLLRNTTLGSLMFKKADWVIVGGYDETMKSGFEDWEFYIRLLISGGNAHIIEEPLFNYRKRIGTTTTRANKKKHELLKYIYLKHQEVYKDNYELIITYLLDKIEREENEKIKRNTRIEYKLGSILLKPFRFIKNIFR